MDWIEYTANKVSNLNDVYGVYVLSTNQTVFYVGSGQIRERLMHHLSNSEENSCIKLKIKQLKCFFWFEEVTGGEDKRKTREEELLASYKERGLVECNQVSPR